MAISSVMSSRVFWLPPGFSGNMARLRAMRMRVEMILLCADALSSAAWKSARRGEGGREEVRLGAWKRGVQRCAGGLRCAFGECDG